MNATDRPENENTTSNIKKKFLSQKIEKSDFREQENLKRKIFQRLFIFHSNNFRHYLKVCDNTDLN